MLTAIEDTANWTTEKIIAIKKLTKHTQFYIRGKLPKTYSRELIETIFEKSPIVELLILPAKVPQQGKQHHLI